MGRKIQKGQTSISATEFNRHVDASDFVLRNLAHGNLTPRRGTANDTNWVSVKNTSGADRRQGEILEFTGLALTDLASRDLILNGGSPTLANGFGVLNSPVKSNDFQPDCQVAGACVGLVNVTSTSHKFATVASATYVLQSASSGPVRILWQPGSTGEKTCALLLGATPAFELFRGITNAQINKGSTTNTVSRYEAGTNTDTGIDDTVTNDWASVKTGKLVLYVKLGATFYIVQTEKASQTLISNLRMKSGNTQIEAEDLDIFVDSVDTLAYSDKVSVSSCP